MCTCALLDAAARIAWRTVAWLLWYAKVATVVLLMTEYNNYNNVGNGDGNSWRKQPGRASGGTVGNLEARDHAY